MMEGLFDNAEFGTMCQTRDGGKAVYLARLYDDSHKVLVQGFEYAFLYKPDGTRRTTGGKYARKYGISLDIVKVGDSL